jgi:hypothetical protein
MDGQLRGVCFRHDMISKLSVLRHNYPILEPQYTLFIYPEIFSFLLFHLTLDVEYTSVSLLELNNSTLESATDNDVIQNCWV